MDSSAIEGLKAEAGTKLATTLDRFHVIAMELSRRDDDIAAWGEQFIKEIGEKYDELLGDMERLRGEIAEKVDAAVAALEGLCSRLHIDAPRPDAKKPLYEKLAQLEEWIGGYREQIADRMTEIDALIMRESSLCSSLGRRPKSIQTDPLPFRAQIDEFRDHLEQLETEKADRLVRTKEAREMIDTLGYSPQSVFEECVCHDDDFFPIDEVADEFDRFHGALRDAMSAMAEEIGALRSEIVELWNLLCVDLLERESIKKKTEGSDWKALRALKAEKKRCVALKMANIEKFVTCLRRDLEETWKKCHCAQDVKEEFGLFDTELFNEEMLQIHETELKRWQEYYEENKELLKLIEKHRELWENMLQLDRNAVNPDRFKNRGGQLLKEEKERKALSKRIPEIEEEMRRLAKEFELRTGREFVTFGSTLEEYIGSLYADRENLKIQKLSARKPKATPGKVPGTSTLKLTPTCKRKLLTPAKTPIAEKMPKSTVDAKVQADVKDIIVSSPGTDRKPRMTAEKRKRLSIERNKRLQKLRKHLRPTAMDGDTEIFSSTLLEPPSEDLKLC